MNTVIWKFPLAPDSMQLIQMPIGARILACQMQQGAPCLWVLVDPNADKEIVEIRLVGTGHPLPSNFVQTFEYIATFHERSFVWHVFRRIA